jgi:hypothetical protein
MRSDFDRLVKHSVDQDYIIINYIFYIIMRIENPDQYRFVRFRKSNTANKKYDAILKNIKTMRTKTVPFGDSRYEHYKDSTGLGLWSHKDHKDISRRRNYRKRHYKTSRYKFSSSYFSFNYLW